MFRELSPHPHNNRSIGKMIIRAMCFRFINYLPGQLPGTSNPSGPLAMPRKGDGNGTAAEYDTVLLSTRIPAFF
jgi:hypothetical protein